MKLSFKTTTRIAAIGMIIYTLFIVTLFLIRHIDPTPYHFILWEDICVRLMLNILPLSLIIAGIGLWKEKPATVSKPFRILTISLLAALGGTLILSPFYVHSLLGITPIFPPFFWRVILCVASIIWLFMLGYQTTEKTPSLSFRVMLIIAMALLALPIVLEVISGINLLFNHSILGLRSDVIQTWVKYIAPILPLGYLSFFKHK